jgi:uncharacterized protein (TIGR03000 family)
MSKKWIYALALALASTLLILFLNASRQAARGEAEETAGQGPAYSVGIAEGHNLIATANRNNTLYFYATDQGKDIGSELKLRATIDLKQVGQPSIKLKEPSQRPVEKATANITVLLPDDAELFFEDVATKQTGGERHFVTPELEVGKAYSYKVVARWQENGKTVEQTRSVEVTAGADVKVDFLTPAKKGDGQAAAPGAAQEKHVVSTSVSHQKSMAGVNFRKQLNLPFPTLETLGSRIGAARRAADPVAMAHAARELAVSEKVSGKKASPTSSAVLKEAAQLAALRKQITELQAVLHVTQQVEHDEQTLQSLKENIALARKNLDAEKIALATKQEPISSPRQVIVKNHTTEILVIYFNGCYEGQMMPTSSQVFTIYNTANPVVLKAYGNDDLDVWGPIDLVGSFDKYTWNIN